MSTSRSESPTAMERVRSEVAERVRETSELEARVQRRLSPTRRLRAVQPAPPIAEAPAKNATTPPPPNDRSGRYSIVQRREK